MERLSGYNVSSFSNSLNHVQRRNMNCGDKHKLKYKRLRKYVKHMIFHNGAVCDEITRVEEKLTKAREERRFLLKNVLEKSGSHHLLTQLDISKTPTKNKESISLTSPSKSQLMTSPSNFSSAMRKLKQEKKIFHSKKKIITDVMKDVKTKKNKVNQKQMVQPIPLDSTGRPVFPVELGNLIVYSLGEIVHERASFHSTSSIFPAGFCSTRIYASLRNPLQHCLYTCKIVDNVDFPKFEISPEDSPEYVISHSDIDTCHSLLLQALNKSCGLELVAPIGQGAQFFGLTHPSIQNLIQSCPGARKCVNYKWIKFEVNKTNTDEVPIVEENASICFEAFLAQESTQAHFSVEAMQEVNSSLQSILTS